MEIIVPSLLLSTRVFMTIDVFLLKYLGMYGKSRFIGLEIPMSPTEISVPMSPPLYQISKPKKAKRLNAPLCCAPVQVVVPGPMTN